MGLYRGISWGYVMYYSIGIIGFSVCCLGFRGIRLERL